VASDISYCNKDMDQYWEKLAENVLEEYFGSPTPTKYSDNSDIESSASPMCFMRVRDDYKRTSSISQKVKSRSRSKSYSEDETNELITCIKKMSLASENVDIFSSFNYRSSIPKSIMRPQHKLSSTWNLWYSVGNKNLSWEQNQIMVCSISTVEQFWYLTSQIEPPSRIPSGHTYSMFRSGVLPDWEDKANVDGGRWMLTFSKKEIRDELDARWLDMLVMLLGDHLPQSCVRVNGAEACVRKKGDRLEVWISDVKSMMNIVEIGRLIKEKIAIGMCVNVKFSVHKEDRNGVKGPRLEL